MVQGLGVGGEGGQAQVWSATEVGLAPWAAAFMCGMAGISSQQLMFRRLLCTGLDVTIAGPRLERAKEGQEGSLTRGKRGR